MVHILTAFYAPPKQHERFKQWMNKLEIPVEGKLRKGFNRPFVTEMKLYDIRVKEEAYEETLKILGQWGGDMLFRGTNHDSHIGNFFGKTWRFAMRLISYFTKGGFNFVDMEQYKKYQTDPNVPKMPGWGYMQVLGASKDPKSHGRELL